MLHYLFIFHPDEMYAAIDEQDKVYTSGSETYAQIQPMALADPVRVQQSEQIYSAQPLHTEESHSSAPQPPSVDSLRHVAHAHSRQGEYLRLFSRFNVKHIVLPLKIVSKIFGNN